MDRLEEIEKYLNKALSKEEMLQFEERIRRDKSLKEEVDFIRSVISGIKNAGIRESIRSIDQEERKRTPSVIWWASGIAASLLVFMLVWSLIPSKLSNDELFEAYFSPYPNVISVRASGNSDLAKVMKYYSSGKYEDAIELFQTILEEGENMDGIQFYKGMSYLSIGQTQKAIDILTPLLNTHSKYQPQVAWYLALAYLKAEEIEKTAQLLESIEEENFKFEEAQKIIQQLK